MNPRAWSFLCLAAGLVLLAIGIQRGTSDQGPTAAVVAFLEAVKTGDKEGSLSLLTPRQQEVARGNLEVDPSPWPNSPRLKYEIQRIEELGNRATAHVFLKESTLQATSEFELRRSPEGVWQIREIRTGPRLHAGQGGPDATSSPASASDAKLEHELRAALLKAPGVIVHRESDRETLRR